MDETPGWVKMDKKFYKIDPWTEIFIPTSLTSSDPYEKRRQDTRQSDTNYYRHCFRSYYFSA
jgi:hypothetical protein